MEEENNQRPPITMIPFPKDPDFVERSELDQVQEVLSLPGKRAALTGFGGIG